MLINTLSALLFFSPNALLLHSPNATCSPIFRPSLIAPTPVLANCQLISMWIAAAVHTTLPTRMHGMALSRANELTNETKAALGCSCNARSGNSSRPRRQPAPGLAGLHCRARSSKLCATIRAAVLAAAAVRRMRRSGLASSYARLHATAHSSSAVMREGW